MALPEITRRFFAVHGPATREEVTRWWGSSPVAAGRMIKELGEELVPVDGGGVPAWMAAADVGDVVGARPSDVVRLVPAFDHYVVAATGHAAELMPGSFRDPVYRPQGWLSPVLLVGGRMEGVWSQQAKGCRLDVHIEPFIELRPKIRRVVEDEAERLAAFAGADLELTWG